MTQGEWGAMSFAHPLIVVVDDDAAVCDALRFSLWQTEFMVIAYCGSADFLAEPTLPGVGCLILADQMQGMKGMELLKQLRSKYADIPTILVSEYTTSDLEARAAAAGISRVIEKPMLNPTLLDTVRSVLRPLTIARTEELVESLSTAPNINNS